MGLLTSSVGSFPKPAALRKARRQFADDEIDHAALRDRKISCSVVQVMTSSSF